ncbi:MAG: alpha/beta fold hydrolase [Xanthomonadales bacterium]|nr:alpha/beta fold hydrolase [Xanthomonadales bacterium]
MNDAAIKLAQMDAFEPSWPWRYGHVQTVLASGPLRRRTVLVWAADLRARAQPVIVDAGPGVRLSGCYTSQRSQAQARGLAIVLHGWEGSADSTYVLETGARLLAQGWDVFRLNLRDHGDSHALNPGLFHSALIDEVVAAVGTLVQRYAAPRVLLAGYSLGGNFALRVGLRAPAAGFSLAAVLAVCPVIDPGHSMRAMEAAAIYAQYFLHKWRASLRHKQRSFPATPYFTAADMRLGLRELTRELIQRHTNFGDLQAYFDAYALSGQRLAALTVPSAILTARDDPVIPLADFVALPEVPALRLDITDYGGHCAFLRHLRAPSYCTDWLVARAAAVSNAA